jgi:hypothetical protein
LDQERALLTVAECGDNEAVAEVVESFGQVTLSSEILDSAAADPASSAWDLIWRESCHQGTCDPDSAVLLPWLGQTCTA